MSGPVCDTGQPFYWLLQQSRLPIIAPMDENNKKPQRDIYTCFYKHLWFSLLVYILFPIYTELCTHIYGGQRLTSVSSLIALHQGIVPLSLSLPKLVDSASLDGHHSLQISHFCLLSAGLQVAPIPSDIYMDGYWACKLRFSHFCNKYFALLSHPSL